MNAQEARALVAQVTYKDGWNIMFVPPKSPDLLGYIQVEVTNSIDAHTKEPTSWKSGKRYLSNHCCMQEVIGTCLSVIKDAEEHEMREFFRFKGRAIYCPHLNPDVLVEVAAKKESYNTRTTNAMNPE